MLDVLAGEISNYPTMLKRIAVYTGAIAFGVTWLVRGHVRWVADALGTLSLPVEMSAGTVNLPLGMVLVALAVTVLSRALKLHDRISDVLRIRHRFDVNKILLPLACASAAPLSPEQIASIAPRRRELMNSVFYKYASSTQGQSAIDGHVVRTALDHWSWYWILVEGFLVVVVGTALLAQNGNWKHAFLLGGGYLVAAGAMLQLLKHLCTRKAEEQIALIVQDPERRNAIGQVFRAL